jgi:hypothetical protein
LLNGGKTGNLQATGQFLATGLTGGKIDFRAKTVSLRGANLDASGEKGGGKILIGGDYQGGDPSGLGTLSNAQSTFVDKYSSISANALTSGDGGKVIVWSDLNTDFRGNINVRGGLKSGDGGFVEVSGKEKLNFVGKVDVKAIHGKQGSVLLDPEDIIINPDDYDESTFDVSNLQSIVGDITLSATNNIVFNVQLFRSNGSTVNLEAGNAVIFKHDYGGIRSKGNVVVRAGNYISGGIFQSIGNVDLSANGDVSIQSIYSDGLYINNNVSVISTKGNINIAEEGLLPSYPGIIAANLILEAYGDITTNNFGIYGSSIRVVSQTGKIDTGRGSIIVERSIYNWDGINGDITLRAKTSIEVGDLYAYGEKSGGNVNISANGSILVHSINTSSNVGGKSGDISVVSAKGNISLGTYFNGGSLSTGQKFNGVKKGFRIEM